jgi:ubiquinone/menaquinone biosynthesis C-methylase UbiE
MISNHYTRGGGILEGFLAKQRAAKANSLILDFQRKGRILDIGCGSCPYFLKTTVFNEKYGIDPSVKNLSEGKIILKKIKVDNQKLPFQDNFFDVVTMLAVIEHIEFSRLPLVLGEIKRVLKKGGSFIVTTPSPWADKLLHCMGKVSLISAEEINEHKHNHGKIKIEKTLEKSGFEKEKIRSGFFESFMNMWFAANK